jgi:hypothetical protein
MERRKNIFIIIMMIVFIIGAKYLKPYEDDIKEYGIWSMILIIILFCFVSALIENIIHKAFKYFKE